jgi:hypothetical protein
VNDGIGREMAGQFGLRFRLPRISQGSFTCHKSATWDRRLYFPSEGRHAVDFFLRKILRLRPGSNPRSWVPETTEAANYVDYRPEVKNFKTLSFKTHLQLKMVFNGTVSAGNVMSASDS